MKKTWCLGELTSIFLARMEQILALYALPYDKYNPVLCYDERPCFLIGDIIQGLEMKAGQTYREHYAYEKNGSCNLLMSLEPLTGKRIAQITEQRRKIEFALHFQQVAKRYPNAKKIWVVLDNLNTHDKSAFYEVFDAEEAKRLSDLFEFVYTPKKASWLNIIEIEFSAISRQCLDRRIPSQEELEKEVMAHVKEREEKQIKINWQFSIETARVKLNRHYTKVNKANEKYTKT